MLVTLLVSHFPSLEAQRPLLKDEFANILSIVIESLLPNPFPIFHPFTQLSNADAPLNISLKFDTFSGFHELKL